MLATQNGPTTLHVLMDRLLDARRHSDALLGLVRTDSLYERPISERHRIVFYLGHLDAFDWNLLHERALGLKSSHPELDRLFAFGIDPVGGGLPVDQPSDWPSLNKVRDYVAKVRTTLDTNLSDEELGSNVQFDGVPLSTLLNVAIEHRLMHVETLAYMLHQLPFEQKLSRSNPVSDSATPPVMTRMVDVPAGAVEMGLSRGGEEFGWDNEYESHSVDVAAFSIDQFKVTNRQYAEFIAAAGYETRSLWSAEDWDWKAARGISHPVFWKRAGHRWLYRTMFEELPLPPDWPVYLSQAEASAYARWVGKLLPTEAEWQRAACGLLHDPGEPDLPESLPANSRNDSLDVADGNPEPVNASAQSQTRFGVRGMFGNGWEWTSSVFNPFPGFKPFPFYRGYSADFFDGKHFVMKGGSPLTAECMLRPTFRNWFQPHYQYVYAGFRCVSR